MTDNLNDHPMAVFHYNENYVGPRERAWLRWVKEAERLLGHSLDGDQDEDGYSMDVAYDEFENGVTPAEYVAIVDPEAFSDDCAAQEQREYDCE